MRYAEKLPGESAMADMDREYWDIIWGVIGGATLFIFIVVLVSLIWS
jgi:hypothetical protein